MHNIFRKMAKGVVSLRLVYNPPLFSLDVVVCEKSEILKNKSSAVYNPPFSQDGVVCQKSKIFKKMYSTSAVHRKST